MNIQPCSLLKIAICTVLFLHLSTVVLSQAPAGMNYQAVARDADGDLLVNRNIAMRFSITNGQAGELLYQERHQTTTNQFGLATLRIGFGTQASGEFEDISWETVTPWLRVEMDPNGGNSYVNMGSSQLMSVPYALHAESSKDGLDPGTASGNTTYWNGTTWVLNSNNIYNNGDNVGINVNAPLGKLHIRGTENVPQLIVDASSTQTNNRPLIKLRRNDGLDLLWIHSDHPSNVFVGVEAAGHNVGTDNTAVGAGTLSENTTGSRNTAIGVHAMFLNTIGTDNTALGIDALANNTHGSNNVAVGNFALSSNNDSSNVAVGVNALKTNTSGTQNTAEGTNALQKNNTGSGNTASGFEAMLNNISGNFRTAVGLNSNSAGPNFNNNTGLGYNAICSASNQVRIGNSEVISIGGFADWTNVSDARFKTNISENVIGLDFINALRPVTYTMDLEAVDAWWLENYDVRLSSSDISAREKETILQTGFIAQEVEATAKALGYEFSGLDAPKNENDFYGLRYGTFVVPLVKAVQEQQVQIEELRKENAMLRAENAREDATQQDQINELQSMIIELKVSMKMQ